MNGNRRVRNRERDSIDGKSKWDHHKRNRRKKEKERVMSREKKRKERDKQIV